MTDCSHRCQRETLWGTCACVSTPIQSSTDSGASNRQRKEVFVQVMELVTRQQCGEQPLRQTASAWFRAVMTAPSRYTGSFTARAYGVTRGTGAWRLDAQHDKCQ